MSVPLRRMRWWDVADARAIEQDLFGPDGWSTATFWSELAHAASRHYVVAGDTEVLGYAGLAVGPDEAYVQTLAVRRPNWGRGVGAALLAELLREADTRGRRPVLLEVRAENARAQALYARFGFELIGRRRGYYQPSGADALVMRRA